MRYWTRLIIATALLCVCASALPARAQSVPAAFLLYPNYRGLIFSDRPEIVVEAPSGASVLVRDKISGATVATVQASGAPVRIGAGTFTQDHPYTVVVQSGGSTVGQWDVTPVPASRRATMNVSFDPKGRLLLHGTPRFGLGVYDAGLGYTTSTATWEQMLFSPTGDRQLGGIPLNLYLNYYYGEASLAAMQALMTTLQNHGMMYLQTGNCFSSGSYTRYPFAIDTTDAYPQQFSQHPGAGGYYIADECVDAMIPETNQHHQRLSRLSPGTANLNVTLAHGYIDPRKWVDSADLLGTDPYPLYGAEPAQGYAHFNVADYTAYLKNAVRDTRPVVSVLQFFQFTANSRFPTFAEERSHAIMSIVEGAKGLFWWCLGPAGLRKSDPATVAAQMGNLKKLVTELAALEPALIADDAPGALAGNSTRYADPVAGRKTQLQLDIANEWLNSNKAWYQAELNRLNAGDTSLSPMLGGAATIRTKTKVVNGKGYVFAYNYTSRSTPVTFTWYQAPGSVTEHLSGKGYTVSGKSWLDTFAAYESRVYVLANGGGTIPAAPPAPIPTPGPTPSPVPSPTPVPAPTPAGNFTAAFTHPTNGSKVNGTLSIGMSTTAPWGQSKTFTLSVDGKQLVSHTVTATTDWYYWNTSAVPNGTHTLRVSVAYQGRTATTAVTINVANGGMAAAAPAPAPAASFTAGFNHPASGSIVNGTLSVGMFTTAPWGYAKTFTLSVDGRSLGARSVTGTTDWYYWDTTRVTNGIHTLAVVVTFKGQTAVARLPVRVQN